MATASGNVHQQLEQVLAEMNRQGGFLLSVLADQQGLAIASAAAPGQQPEVHAAAVALVQKTATQARDQLGMAPTDELSVFDADGRRLVCRPFSVDERRVILAVMVPRRGLPYRRLTNAALRSLRQILRALWE
ncbi:MAG: hypothetical protein AB1449_00900 [Chloroflexota bacterium]